MPNMEEGDKPMPLKKERKQLKIDFKNVDDLLLDPENPRLSVVGESKSQDELVKVLWDEMAVDEVALSIAANGYFEEEPLFVIPQPASAKGSHAGKYMVVEGNRRFAAVRLLREGNLRKKVKATDLPEITPEACKSLEELPVSVYPDKKSLWEYFGFRHVNGPMAWDPISKAAYVAQVRRKYNIPLEEIALKIGDKHQTVVKMYRGFLLLEQAERTGSFNPDDRKENHFNFSHLYTAATYKEFQTFLGVEKTSSLRENPVPRDHLAQLQELMIWLFGSKREDKLPIVEKQNPDLNLLKTVVGNRQALLALRSGISLKRSHEISLGDRRLFQEALVRTKDALHEAKSTVTTGYKGEADLLNMMDEILQLANSIADEMHKKVKG
jgi:hypothetical protein